MVQITQMHHSFSSFCTSCLYCYVSNVLKSVLVIYRLLFTIRCSLFLALVKLYFQARFDYLWSLSSFLFSHLKFETSGTTKCLQKFFTPLRIGKNKITCFSSKITNMSLTEDWNIFRLSKSVKVLDVQ